MFEPRRFSSVRPIKISPFLPLALMANVVLCACGASDSPEKGTAVEAPRRAMTDAPGGPAIRVLVGGDGLTPQSIYLPPYREGVAPRGNNSPALRTTRNGASPNPPTLRSKDVNPGIADGDPAEWLLVGAAVECGVGTKQAPDKALSGLLSMPPWKTDSSWYIFSRAPTSCDELLMYQQALLCTAQALSKVATATAPIHWKEVASLDTGVIPGWTIPPGAWTLLPQDQDSQFIALDVQRNVLAHLAKLDTYQVPGLERLCSHEYSLELDWRPDTAEIKRELYGGKPGELPAFQIEKETGLADTTIRRNKSSDFTKIRLQVQTHTLRAASRMLEENIRLAVAADMAGAERKRAKENDPLRGNEAAWGLSAQGRVDSTQYNNYRHALRVLEGRLEMGAEGTPAADPAMRGYAGVAVDIYSQRVSDGKSHPSPSGRNAVSAEGPVSWGALGHFLSQLAEGRDCSSPARGLSPGCSKRRAPHWH